MAIPSLIVKSMVQRFDKQWSSQTVETEEADDKQTLALLLGAGLELDAQIKTTIQASELLKLAEGSVLVLDYPVDRPVACALNNRLKYHAVVGSGGSRRVVRIEASA